MTTANCVKTQFHIRGFNVNAGLRRRLEHSLEQLESITSVTAAAVVLEHRRDDAPPVNAYVSLAVPGPDINAEACDHTLEAAWLRVTIALRRQIEQRKARQQPRLKGHRQHPLKDSRWSSAAVVGRS